MRKIFLSLLAVLALVVLPACTQKQTPPPAQPARISTTPAYEEHFGPAPTSDKGTCFAFVIYFPSAREAGKVVPFPFFTFDEASIRKVAVERLLAGMDIGSYNGEFLQPFPTGTHIVSISEAQGTVTLTLSKEFGRAIQDKSAETAEQAVTLTLRQFKGVAAVRILVEGNNAPLDVQADKRTILPPGPPRLLSVTAMKDKGAKAVEEVNAFFDRPVNVTTLKIMDSSGKPFKGDVYHSVFDMAAVLKPKEPERFNAGMPVQVRWDVSDKLGRKSQGTRTLPLEVREHVE